MPFQCGRNAGIGVCTSKGAILKVMVQNKIQVRQQFLLIYFGKFWTGPCTYTVAHGRVLSNVHL
jgi:hypothetical protein